METKIKYQIYRIIAITDGNNKLFQQYGYDSYDSFDEALQILKEDGNESTEYTILPIIKCY